MPRWQNIPTQNWDRAREMRRLPTSAEKLLWQALRSNQLGVRFRRQHPIGPYIVDFYAPERKLVIEVDGDPHFESEQVEYDLARTTYLDTMDVRVKRYTNGQVHGDLASVLADIRKTLG
jgi:very-short-patch-repair endonuclease